MSKQVQRYLLVCLSAVLLSSAGFGTAFAGGDKGNIPVGEFHARRFADPPTIDGNIKPGEWDDALTVSGAITVFGHELLQAETTWRFGFDDERFYFLAECTRGNNEWRLKKSARQNDDYAFGDSSVEIWVSPPKTVEETYQNIINTYPAVRDVKNVPSRGYSGMGWTGDWKLGVDERSDRYFIEAAIPIEDFGIEDIQDGDVWKFLLARTAPGTQPRAQASWGVTGGFGEISGYPKVHLMDDTALLQVTKVLSVFRGKLNFPMTVVAPRQEDDTVTVKVRVQEDVEASENDKILTRKVSVQKGERKSFKFQGSVEEIEEGFVTISATSKDGTEIYRHTLPFTVNGFEHQTPEKPEDASPIEPLSLKTKYGPENNVVLVNADIINLEEREQVAGAEVKIIDSESGKVLQRKKMPAFRNWYSDGFVFLKEGIDIPVFDVSDVSEEKVAEIKAHNREIKQAKKELESLKEKENPDEEKIEELEKVASRESKSLPRPDVEPRTVDVEVVLRNDNGENIARNEEEVALLRRKFRWQNNDIGVTEEVIPPWEPVTYDKGDIGVWNRTMDVNGLGLLERVDNGGVDQIKAMRLVAVVDGQKKEIQPSRPNLKEHVEAYAVVEGEGSGAGLDLSATTKVEFDGYAFSELTIAPQGNASSVDKLYLEVVLPEEEATHFHSTAGGWSAQSGKTPEHWTSQQTSSGLLIGDFVPYIWLTNSERAFVWFADNDKGWITDDGGENAHPTQEVIREDGEVTLRVHFIELPTTLEEATTVRYGYQTYPSRPLPDGWRSIVCQGRKQNFPDARNTYFWTKANWAVSWPYYCSPYPWSMAKSKKTFDRLKDRSYHRPMVGSIAHAIARYRDYDGYKFPKYAVDWGKQPGRIGNGNVTQGEGPNDFRLYHYQRWVREAGFQGLYVDENYLSLNSNFLSSNAYIRSDGRLQRGYDYTGLREYFKRMKVMFHENDVPSPNLWQHVTAGAAHYAWLGDIFFVGENIQPSDLEHDYLKVLPAGRMRAIASAKTAGGVMTMMCQARRHGTAYSSKHIHQFVGWVMAHDVLPEQVTWYNPIAQAGRFYRADVDFYGYWEEDNPVQVRTEGAIASVHTTEDRAVVWVVNKRREDRNVDLGMDLEALGMNADNTVAIDVETGEALPLADGGLSLHVLKRDFKAFHLIERPDGEEALRFKAGFDADEKERATFAAGANRFLSSEHNELKKVAGSEGKGLSTPAKMWTHLNMKPGEGRLVFDAKIPEEAYGTVLQMGTLKISVKRDGTMALVSNRNPINNVYHGRVRRKEDKDNISLASFDAPEAGWHTLDISWTEGQVTLKIDGEVVAETSLVSDWLGKVNPRGPAIRTAANIAFGPQPRRDACVAIDNVRCYGPKE